MAFIPVPDTLEVFLKWGAGEVTIGILFHFIKGAAWVQSDAEALVAALEGWRVNTLRPLYNAGAVATEWRATDIRSETGFSIVVPISGTGAGTRAGTVAPRQVAAVVSKRTPLRGRSYRGRTYMPFLSETDVSDDTVETSYLNDLMTAWASMTTVVNGLGWGYGVVSRYTEKAPRTTGVLTLVSSIIADAVVDTQRRRI